MPAGYVRAWIIFLNALDYVEQVAGCARQEACDGVLDALRDGAVQSRFSDTGEAIDPSQWYRAEIYVPGTVVFSSDPTDRTRVGQWPSNRWAELLREDVERLWPAEPPRMTDPDPNERLTLPDQVRLLARIMPEDQASARIGRAFRLKEIIYQPDYAFPYHDARIDWATGVVILRRAPRQPFMPTLGASEFFRHLMPAGAIAGSGVAQVPPHDAKAEGALDGDPLTHSGFPGRPAKSKHLIENEFRQRIERAEVLTSLTDEAVALLAWFVQEHPQMPRPTQRTIENNIREIHRRWRAGRDDQAEAS